MLIFFLTLAFSVALAFAVNAIRFDRYPCSATTAVVVTIAIIFASAVFGIVGTILILKGLGYAIDFSSVAILPACIMAGIASWSILNRKKPGEGPTTLEQAGVGEADTQGFGWRPGLRAIEDVVPPEPGVGPIRNTSMGISKRTRISVLFGGTTSLAACLITLYANWDDAVDWGHLGLVLMIIGILTALMFVLMKDGSWPLK